MKCNFVLCINMHISTRHLHHYYCCVVILQVRRALTRPTNRSFCFRVVGFTLVCVTRSGNLRTVTLMIITKLLIVISSGRPFGLTQSEDCLQK